MKIIPTDLRISLMAWNVRECKTDEGCYQLTFKGCYFYLMKNYELEARDFSERW